MCIEEEQQRFHREISGFCLRDIFTHAEHWVYNGSSSTPLLLGKKISQLESIGTDCARLRRLVLYIYTRYLSPEDMYTLLHRGKTLSCVMGHRHSPTNSPCYCSSVFYRGKLLYSFESPISIFIGQLFDCVITYTKPSTRVYFAHAYYIASTLLPSIT